MSSVISPRPGRTAEKTKRKRAAPTSTRVYNILREKAINYSLRPGEHVNELALASELNVSRTPVRDALNRLVREGLMTFVPNKGFFLRPLDIEQICSLFEIRSALEILSVRLCSQRAQDEEIDAMIAEWGAVKRNRGNLTTHQLVRRDEVFHERLADCTANKELSRLLRDINSRIRIVRLVAMEPPQVRRITFHEHDGILTAIRDRDEAKAIERMQTHISITLEDVTSFVKKSVARIYLGEAGVLETAPPLPDG